MKADGGWFQRGHTSGINEVWAILDSESHEMDLSTEEIKNDHHHS